MVAVYASLPLLILSACWSLGGAQRPASPEDGQLTRFGLALQMERVLLSSPGSQLKLAVERDGEPVSFPDLEPALGAKIQKVLDLHAMKGFPDGTFRPDDHVSDLESLYIWANLISSLERRGILRVSPELEQQEVGGRGKRLPAWIAPSLRVLERCGIDPFDRVLPGESPVSGLSEKIAPRLKARIEGKKPFSEPELEGLPKHSPAEAEGGGGKGGEPATNQHGESDPVIDSQPAPGSSRLTIEVQDSLTRRGLAGVRVSVGGRVYQTDGSGKCQVTELPDGRIAEIFAAKEGYRKLSLRQKIGGRSGMRFFLRPILSSLKLKIVSSVDGSPLEGVKAAIGARVGKSGQDGALIIKPLKPGYHELKLSGSGILESEELVFVEHSATSLTLRAHPIL